MLMTASDPERPVIVERLAASIYKQGESEEQGGRQRCRGGGFPAGLQTGAGLPRCAPMRISTRPRC